MKLRAVLLGVLVTSACGTASPPEPAVLPPSAPVVATDPRVGELETTIRELTDRMEVMQARLEAMEDVVQSTRSVQQNPSSSAARTEVERTTTRQAAVVDASNSYREAQIMFGRGQIENARTAFEQVFRADPVGDLADNALYWIGETYFVMGQHRSAIRVYDRIIRDFSSQNKAPDAMLRKGQALVKLGDLALAREVFRELVDRYSWSPAASAAKGELARIRY